MTTGMDRQRASDLELVDLMATMKASDSVELKMTVQNDEHHATVGSLPIDPVEAQPRQVFFFDTPDLQLNQAGVVVRARRIQGGRGDTVVKLRPVVPQDLPDELRKSPAFNVEVDVLPGGHGICSASLKGRVTGTEIRDAVRGDLPLRKLFTKDQRAFYKDHAPEGLEFESLQTLGPTFVMKSVFEPEDLGRRVVAELWLYPDGVRILELSTKCLPGEAFQVAAEARAYLAKNGITVEIGGQQTKTKTALEFFSAHLVEAGSSDPVDDALGGMGSAEASLPISSVVIDDEDGDDASHAPIVGQDLDDDPS
jgi:hypothetical protein